MGLGLSELFPKIQDNEILKPNTNKFKSLNIKLLIILQHTS